MSLEEKIEKSFHKFNDKNAMSYHNDRILYREIRKAVQEVIDNIDLQIKECQEGRKEGGGPMVLQMLISETVGLKEARNLLRQSTQES